MRGKRRLDTSSVCRSFLYLRGWSLDCGAVAPVEDDMLMIREVMNCKPVKVRPMVEKFLAMSKVMQKNGMGKMRVLTDVSAEQYWTIVAEIEVESLDKFMSMDSSPEMKELEPLMKGYHDFVDHGRREIYKVEG